MDPRGIVGIELHHQLGIAELTLSVKEPRLEQLTITRHGTTTAGEYRAHVSGIEQTGVLEWTEADGVRSANSTRVPVELRGRGIAGKLVDALIADAREQGFRIRPVCSYVEAAFGNHPEWADLRA